MKKTKLMGYAALSVLTVASLGACSKASDVIVDKDYVLQEPGTLKDGFTSLQNKYTNPAVDKDGNATIAGKTFKVVDNLKTTYLTEPTKDKFNYLTNTWTYNSYHYANMVDGLVENNRHGDIVGAIALGYKREGKVWTFQLRKNAEWVDNKTGKRFNDKVVTAHDFVAAAKYVLDKNNGSGTVSLYQNFIEGADAYYADPSKGFDTVGVKAIDDFTLQYTTVEETPYFLSVLTYSPFLPVNADYLKSQGTDFGSSVDNILVNGAFRVTTHVPLNKMVYTKNYHYYDRDNVFYNHVTRTFVPTDSPLSTTRQWYEAGTLDHFTVNESDEAGWNTYVKGSDKSGDLKNPANNVCNSTQQYYGATYIGYYNVNRTFYEFNANQSAELGCVVTTDEQRKDAFIAKLNVNFRKGFLHGLNVLEYLKRFSKDDPKNYLVRDYTNKELVSYEGKDYTDYVLDEYNSHQKEEKKVDALIGVDSKTKDDPIYDADLAKQYFTNAYNEIKATAEKDGRTASFPIIIDFLGTMNPENQTFEKEMLKAVEANSKINDGGKDVQVVKINYNIPRTEDENTKWGSEVSNFDFSMWSGWGPDYADPNTYLHTMAIYGDMVDYLGLPLSESARKTTALCDYATKEYSNLIKIEKEVKDYTDAIEKLQNDFLGAYNTIYKEAAAEQDVNSRYEKFAKAEYNLIYESAIILPWYSKNGYYAKVTKCLPYVSNKSSYGITNDEHKFKNTITTDHAVTKEEYKALKENYEKELAN